jgi:prepilin signal peptidase PulO-like enzyme (type II secretory pathway)
LVGVLGLVFGSCATSLSYRLPRGLPVASARSCCPACKHALGAADLLPIVSWLSARGRCRHCGGAVSWRYPLIELTTAVLFLAGWWQADGDLLLALLLCLTAFCLVVIAVADFESGIIPDPILAAMLPLALAWRWHGGGDWLDGAAGAFVALLVSSAARQGFRLWRRRLGMGLGDVKFLGVAGVYVGLSGLGGLLIGAGLVGVLFGGAWRLAGRGAVFPFGPALCLVLFGGLFFPGLLAGEALPWQ